MILLLLGRSLCYPANTLGTIGFEGRIDYAAIGTVSNVAPTTSTASYWALTNDDLKDIGVASFGHRKKLLEAIAELGGAPAATSAPRPVVPSPVQATVAPPPTSASVEAAVAISR